MRTLAHVAAAMLIGSTVVSILRQALGGANVSGFGLLLGAVLVVLLMFLSRRRTVPPRLIHDVVTCCPAMADDEAQVPIADSSLDRGVRDIRRTDPNFDPRRFVGYAAMVFRAAHSAWTTRDIESLRDRVTREMYGALQAQCERLRNAHRVNHADEIEITAEITEAWQENGRDYVTANIRGSIVDYTVDATSDVLVDGSRTIPRTVDEFWTFARPAGLNFWMLSAIQAT